MTSVSSPTMVKKGEGSLGCGVCYNVTNKLDAVQCTACNTAKPRYEAQEEKENQAVSYSGPRYVNIKYCERYFFIIFTSTFVHAIILQDAHLAIKMRGISPW